MPRNVRNFWIDLQVDGRAAHIGAGPIAKDGGFRLSILMRDNGDILRAYRITGQANADGSLHLFTDVGKDVVERINEEETVVVETHPIGVHIRTRR